MWFAIHSQLSSFSSSASSEPSSSAIFMLPRSSSSLIAGASSSTDSQELSPPSSSCFKLALKTASACFLAFSYWNALALPIAVLRTAFLTYLNSPATFTLPSVRPAACLDGLSSSPILATCASKSAITSSSLWRATFCLSSGSSSKSLRNNS